MVENFYIPASTNSVPEAAARTNIINLQSHIRHTIKTLQKSMKLLLQKHLTFSCVSKGLERVNDVLDTTVGLRLFSVNDIYAIKKKGKMIYGHKII
jgi:hypothetical protein